MPTRVKICGITRLEDARLTVELGAAALGFNFFRPSPRYLAAEAAREIIGQLPLFVTAVGVFADEVDGENVGRVARQAGVAVIQLHGPRFPATSPALESYPLIRALAVKPDFQPAELARLKARAFLLDAFDAALPGGTG
jgi:phosphoribosylanthranilate isomerase